MGLPRKRAAPDPEYVAAAHLRHAIRTALFILSDRKSMTAKELASVRAVLREALEN